MKRTLQSLSIAVILFTAFPAFGQDTILHRVYTGNSKIYGLEKDRIGRIWAYGDTSYNVYFGQFAAYFDGVKWIRYQQEQPFVDQANLGGFTMDNKPVFYVNNSLYIFDGDTMQELALPANIFPAGSAFQKFKVDNEGNFWFLVQLQGNYPYNTDLIKWDGFTVTSWDSSYHHIDATSINNWIFGPDNKLYICSAHKISSFDGNNWQVIDASPMFAQSVTFDNDDSVYVLAYGIYNNVDTIRILQLSGGVLSQLSSLEWSDLAASDLIKDDDGIFWMANAAGVIRWDGISPTFIQSLGYTYGCYPRIFRDEIGDVWFGGSYRGCSETHWVLQILTTEMFISGTVFWDTNADGIFDAGDDGLPNQVTSIQSLNYFASTDPDGNYNLRFNDSSATYACSYQTPLNWVASTPTNYSVTPVSQPTTGYNFGITPSSLVKDLKIDLASYIPNPKCCLPNTHTVILTNAGTESETDVVYCDIDSSYIIDSIYPASGTVNDHEVSWSFSNLLPFEQRAYQVFTHLSFPVTINLPVTSVAHVNSVNDQNPDDNADTLHQHVVGSWDPNEKESAWQGALDVNDEIKYTIHFQNTGNSDAELVIIRDTLDANLDPVSFKFISSSHPVKPTLSGAGNLGFYFQNINLPDSGSDQSASSGFVKYSVKPRATVSTGTHIRNDASIYFDFNLPVVTNETDDIVGGYVAVNSYHPDFNFLLHPNPSSDKLIIGFTGNLLPENSFVVISNPEGKRIFKQAIKTGNTELNIQWLPNGMYFIAIESYDHILATKKFVKL